MRVSELLDGLLARFPLEDAEPWDHIGLSVGNPDAEVNRIACALDAGEQNVVEAARLGANVLLTHHPVYLNAPRSFCPASPSLPASSAAVYEAARLGVSIISLHTNLDRSNEARFELPGLLGMAPSSTLEFPDDPSRPGLGAICDAAAPIPLTLSELARRCAVSFGTEPRVWGAPERKLSKVAFLGGSLGDFGDHALAVGCDAIVTGEAGYHVAQDVSLRGCSVVLLGHDRSEEPFCDILARACLECGVEGSRIDIIRGPRQWWTVNQGGRA